MLKAKVDAGATRAITQFFFENDLYFRYLDRVRARGIDIPIVPGILPVQNFKQTDEFRRRAAAPSVPRWLAERFDGLDDDVATRKLIAAAVAAEQVLDLVDRGVTDFHFYTMNRADLVYAICHLLGLRPAAETKQPERCPTTRPTPAPEALLARSRRERILVLDGAMGTMIQELQARRGGLSRRALRRLEPRGARQQRPAEPDAGRTRSATSISPISAPAPTSSRPTRSPRPRSRRPTTAWRRSPTS